MPDLEPSLRTLLARDAADVDPTTAARLRNGVAPRHRRSPYVVMAAAAAVATIAAGSVLIGSHATVDPRTPEPQMTSDPATAQEAVVSPSTTPDDGTASSKPSTPSKPRKRHSPGSGLPDEYNQLMNDGYLELRLGMTLEEARQTGRFQLGDDADGCLGLYLAMYGDGSGLNAHGFFTEAHGLSVIYGQGDMRTAEGVTGGTSERVLRDTYPDLRESRDGLLRVQVSETTELFFRLAAGVVERFGVALINDPCTTRGLPA